MKQLTQKYCLISLLEPVDETGFVKFSWKDWVLHVTFAGVHFAEWNNEMIYEFEKLIQSVENFKVKTLNQGKLGVGETSADVVFVEKRNDVLNLHSLIIDFLDSHNAVFNNPEWNRTGFIPHSTIQKHAQVPENEIIPINNIVLIDMFPDGDGYMRKIIRVFKLKK
jgi:hypothetical protein